MDSIEKTSLSKPEPNVLCLLKWTKNVVFSRRTSPLRCHHKLFLHFSIFPPTFLFVLTKLQILQCKTQSKCHIFYVPRSKTSWKLNAVPRFLFALSFHISPTTLCCRSNFLIFFWFKKECGIMSTSIHFVLKRWFFNENVELYLGFWL